MLSSQRSILSLGSETEGTSSMSELPHGHHTLQGLDWSHLTDGETGAGVCMH